MSLQWMKWKVLPLGLIAFLCLGACSPRDREEDRRLVTLLGEVITRDDYEHEPDIPPGEAERMRGDLSPEEWAIWEQCVRWRPLRERIHHELMQWFVEEHQLTPTREEVEAYIDYVNIQPMKMHMPDFEVPGMPDEDSHEWQRAVAELTEWKTQNTLYDLYGGRVAVGRPALRMSAMDAYHQFLRVSEEAGRIQFHSDAWREVFWACVTLDAVHAPREYGLDEDEGALEALREYPGTRRLRIFFERLTQIRDDGWMEFFEQMEHPPGW